jgi:hypothetical protein
MLKKGFSLRKNYPDHVFDTSFLLAGFPGPIPGIVFLTAGTIFPGAIDSDILKILYENIKVFLKEGFQAAGDR